MTTNVKGHLEIGGCDAVELAEQYGTPLYVMDETLIRKNCRAYVDTFRASVPDALVTYASKVFSTRAMCCLVQQEGMGLDVVSGGELHTALSVGFPAEKIFFHGNNKSRDELEMALQAGVGTIVADNFYELDLLNGLAGTHSKKANVILRLSPGIDAHTHHYIKTGTVDSKFGFVISNGQAMQAVVRAEELPNLILQGIHCHIGSQIFDLTSFREAADVMVAFLAEVKGRIGRELPVLNLGGGLGIYYSEGDSPQDITLFAQRLVAAVKDAVTRYGLALPRLIVEPGRSIVGEAGTTLYRIGSVKEIPGVRTYVAVDGGMTDNPRPALYQAKYEAALANRMNEKNTDVVSIAGKCCESGDMLIWDVELPAVKSDDILAVSSTGAYNYSMASNYNRNTRPAVVFVADGKAEIVVRRETLDDLIRCDMVPKGWK